MFMGSIYILFWISVDWEQFISMKYLVNALSFIIIGLGMIVAYFEENNKIQKHNEYNYKSAVESSSDGIWEYDVLNQSLKLPKAAMEILRIREDVVSLQLRKLEKFIHRDDADRFKSSFGKNELDKLIYYRQEFRIKIAEDNYKSYLFTGKIITNNSNKPSRIVGFTSDITEEKIKAEIMYKSAYFDKTTSLPNWNYVEQQLLKDMKEHNYFTILSIKLLGFKNRILVNGEDSGKDLLNKVIENIKKHLSKEEVLARVDQDKFICVLYYSEYNEVKITVDKILEGINNSKVISNYQYDLKAVMGISIYPNDAEEYINVFNNANLAMQKSIEERKDHKFYEESIVQEMKNKNEIKDMLQKAIDKQEFKVFYQLQKAGDESRFVGGESLIRWTNPEKGIISPGEFIPIAEETGQIIDIGEIVLKEACYTGKTLHMAGYKNFYVAVNISPVQLRDDNFYRIVKRILSKSEFSANHLILEMSEKVFDGSMKNQMQTLEAIKNLGVKIAVDDYGRGTVPFNYLLNSPIDILKIDKSFVFGMMGSPKKINLIEALVSIGKKLGYIVVVQGIETEEQLEVIKKLNCDWMQGFLFSKPEQSINGKLV
jgi:diguanylate cyclase (GGDEF)-like protein